MDVFPLIEKLMSAAPLITDSRRLVLSRVDTTLDLESSRHGLVVLPLCIPGQTSFHFRFDLQGASCCLIVLHIYPASFYIRFDFHRGFPFFENRCWLQLLM